MSGDKLMYALRFILVIVLLTSATTSVSAELIFQKVAEIGIPSEQYEIVINGNVLYALADASNGIAIIDISDIENPKIIKFWQPHPDKRIHKFIVDGKYGYASFDGYIDILDLSDPTDPTIIGEIDLGRHASWGLCHKNNYLFHGGYGKVRIVDISSKMNPKIISEVSTTTWPLECVVVGNYLYVLGRDNSNGSPDKSTKSNLEIIDISNIEKPKSVAVLPLEFDTKSKRPV